MHASRRRLVEAALAEDALLVASHVEGVGRLAETLDHATWTPVS